MTAEIKQRLKWIKLYQETGNAGLVCMRCGISRPTLRKWLTRYQQAGEAGLESMSRRPHHSPNRKVNESEHAHILRLRDEKKGARRIQSELRLYEQKSYSLRTIHKVLKTAEVKLLVKPKRHCAIKRYSRPIPGDRIQIDTMKVTPNLYQYTAIDDCSRFRVLGLYPRRDACSAVLCCFSSVSLKKCHFQYSVFRAIEERNFLLKMCSVI